MEKAVCKVVFGFVLLCALALVFVSSVEAAGSHVVERGDTLAHIARLHGTTWPVLAEYNGLTNPHLIFPRQVVRIPSGLYRVWTVEELGEIIVAAGDFWEEWWSLLDRFDSIHFWDRKEQIYVPLEMRGLYAPLSPSSGFGSLDDVRNYLLQFYTVTWVEGTLNMSMSPFVEHNGVLFAHFVRAGFSRINWDTATHILVERYDNRVIVETSALKGMWDWYTLGDDPMGVEVAIRFFIKNGRIDRVEGWGLFGL